MFLGEPERVRVAAAARCDGRLKDDRATDDLDDRERVRIAVRIDTDLLPARVDRLGRDVL